MLFTAFWSSVDFPPALSASRAVIPTAKQARNYKKYLIQKELLNLHGKEKKTRLSELKCLLIPSVS